MGLSSKHPAGAERRCLCASPVFNVPSPCPHSSLVGHGGRSRQTGFCWSHARSLGHFPAEQSDSDKARGMITCGLCHGPGPPKCPAAVPLQQAAVTVGVGGVLLCVGTDGFMGGQGCVCPDHCVPAADPSVPEAGAWHRAMNRDVRVLPLSQGPCLPFLWSSQEGSRRAIRTFTPVYCPVWELMSPSQQDRKPPTGRRHLSCPVQLLPQRPGPGSLRAAERAVASPSAKPALPSWPRDAVSGIPQRAPLRVLGDGGAERWCRSDTTRKRGASLPTSQEEGPGRGRNMDFSLEPPGGTGRPRETRWDFRLQSCEMTRLHCLGPPRLR